MFLPEGRILSDGRYRVDEVLGQGGCGITYLATDLQLGMCVAIKEFFLREFCSRAEDGIRVKPALERNEAVFNRFCKKFLWEAKTISSLRHPNIINVDDVFQENGTAYYVMEYVYGKGLDKLVAERGPLPEAEAVHYISQVASALEYVHDHKTLHLDVKPSNILIDGSRAVLIDFGISKHYDSHGSQTSSTPSGISPGYSPIEQNNSAVKFFSPAIDVYALAATLYKAVSGNTPPSASDVMESGPPKLSNSVSRSVRNAIVKGMAPVRTDRIQNMRDFQKVLSGDNRRKKTGKPQKQKKKSKGILVTIMVFLFFLLASMAVVFKMYMK